MNIGKWFKTGVFITELQSLIKGQNERMDDIEKAVDDLHTDVDHYHELQKTKSDALEKHVLRLERELNTQRETIRDLQRTLADTRDYTHELKGFIVGARTNPHAQPQTHPGAELPHSNQS